MNIAFIVDSNKKIGGGHFYRSLNFAEFINFFFYKSNNFKTRNIIKKKKILFKKNIKKKKLFFRFKKINLRFKNRLFNN